MDFWTYLCTQDAHKKKISWVRLSQLMYDNIIIGTSIGSPTTAIVKVAAVEMIAESVIHIIPLISAHHPTTLHNSMILPI
jgi:hypothetical protein